MNFAFLKNDEFHSGIIDLSESLKVEFSTIRKRCDMSRLPENSEVFFNPIRSIREKTFQGYLPVEDAIFEVRMLFKDLQGSCKDRALAYEAIHDMEMHVNDKNGRSVYVVVDNDTPVWFLDISEALEFANKYTGVNEEVYTVWDTHLRALQNGYSPYRG